MKPAAKPPSLLVMLRPDLDHLPELHLPPGYELRPFRAGDQAGWNAMVDLAFEREPGATSFAREMRSDPDFRPERVLVVVREFEIAATASAWHLPEFGRQCGYLRWVATHPRHLGQKLGYNASLGALHRMRTEKRTVAILKTDDYRGAAIRMYLALGFQPAPTEETHRARWKTVLKTLTWPESLEHRIEGPLLKFPL